MKKLLLLLLNRSECIMTSERLVWGLCDVTEHLRFKQFITAEEESILKTYIKKNMPQNYPYVSGIFEIVEGMYGWEPGAIEPRLKWLEEHIKLNS